MNAAEEALYSHLTETESLDYLIKQGFTTPESREVITSEVGRKLVQWAIDYYFQSERMVAPSKEAIMETWGDQLSGQEIEINDQEEQDSIQWAVDQLRTEFVDYQTGIFAQALAKAVRKADPPDRPKTLQEYSDLLHYLAQVVLDRKSEMSGAVGIDDALRRYETLAREGHKFQGMTFGLPEVDKHTLGIHNGEMAVFVAPSAGGKSWWSLLCLLSDWERERRTMLFTLENDLEMTYDRLACVQCKVPYEKWQRGECNEGEILRVKTFAHHLKENDRFMIVHPREKDATGVAMIRRAVVEEADTVIIDQLSHVKPPINSKARQRNEVVADTVRDLNWQIKDANIPLCLLHQINREGQKDVQKSGKFEQWHLGEAKQTYDDASWVGAIYQSPDAKIAQVAELQEIKFRRGPLKRWQLVWRPEVGDVRVKMEIPYDE